MLIWSTPSSAAKQGHLSISVQQAMSLVLSGRVRIFVILAVPETVPRRTNQGERPFEDRRDIILYICGRYETSIPTTIKLQRGAH